MLACTVPPGSSSISGRMMEMVLPVSIVSLQALPPTVPDKVSPSTAPRTDPALKDIGCLSFSNGAWGLVLVAGLCPSGWLLLVSLVLLVVYPLTTLERLWTVSAYVALLPTLPTGYLLVSAPRFWSYAVFFPPAPPIWHRWSNLRHS